MSVEPPLLDSRTFAELLQQLTQRARAFVPAWHSREQGDAGMVLAAIYSHYLEILLERLNRVPEKSLLAFLDLMGVGLLPPGAAAAPVAFTLAPTAGTSGFVPRGTQIATVQTETQPAVVFETEQDVNVVAAQLVVSFTIEPDRDRYADRTALARQEARLTVPLFVGDRLLEHVLLLGVPTDLLLLVQRPGRLLVEMTMQPTADLVLCQELLQDLHWEVRQAGDWQPLAAPVLLPLPTGFRLSFSAVMGPEVTTVSGIGLTTDVEKRWVRARMARPLGKVADPLTTALSIRHVRMLGQTAICPDEGWAAVPSPLRPAPAPIGRAVNYTADFLPFGDPAVSPQEFWLASLEGFAAENAVVHVIVDLARSGRLPEAVESGEVRLEWEFWAGTQWQAIGASAPGAEPEALSDTTELLQHSGRVSFTRPAEMVFGQPDPRVSDSYWIRVRLVGRYVQPPVLRAVHILRGLRPDVGVTGTSLADMTLPFHPLGVQPKLNDVLYIGSQEALGQRGATGHILFSFAQPGVPTPGISRDDDRAGQPVPSFRLVWEYSSPRGWQPLGQSEVRFTLNPDTGFPRSGVLAEGITDSTNGFSQDGEVAFTVPDDIAIADVAGQSSYWVRVRLARGDFGRPVEFVLNSSTNPAEGFRQKLDTGNVRPPIVQSLTLAYNYEQHVIQPMVVTRNGFISRDRTPENAQADGFGASLFVPVDEQNPTFYLGFDRQLPNNAVNLYFVVPPRQFVEKPGVAEATGEASTGDPRLVWEYWNGRQWTELVVVDATAHFTESGGVQFLGPTDLTPLAQFDPTLRFWIRVRLMQGGNDYAPVVSGVFLNTIRMVQATTIADELVGSSNGRQNQVFRLSTPPVFPGQRLLVREPERPSAEEEAVLQEGGDDTIQRREGTAGATAIWVRWHEVDSLHSSGARSRHYTLNHITGEVRFGDGVHGLIPPEGRDNIVCETYRTGGGAGGNQPVGAISQLKTSIPYIAAVTNPVAADGGSDAEALHAVQERGPQILKHRRRAVTLEDFEWLARQAVGTRVVRATCLPNRNRDLDFEPGWTTVIIVPSGTEKKLLPSAELIRAVEDDLATRSLATLTGLAPARINVIGPGYMPVELAVEVVPLSLTQADAVRRACLAALDRFLHPLTGGPEGRGWTFGRDVFLSELYAAFEALPGVEHVPRLRFKPTVATVPLQFTRAAAIAYPEGSTVTVTDRGSTLQACLVERMDKGMSEAMVTLFREGERLRLTPQGGDTAYAVESTIRGISGHTLSIDPFEAQVTFPVGSVVTSVDGPSTSFVTAEILHGATVRLLPVQGFTPGLSLTFPDGSALTLQESEGTLDLGQRLRVPEFYLVYSGAHTLDIVPQ